MELKLKHLVPYMPYGLRFATDFDHMKYIMAGLETQQSIVVLKAYNNAKKKKKLAIKTLVKYNYKPILRPPSDLTKEIEHKGIRFIPIVELLKIIFGEIENYNLIKEFAVEMTIENQVYMLAVFSKNNFYLRLSKKFENQSREILDITKYQDLINKLCEWHFDFQNLIPQGLALDINTLNKKTWN